MSETKTPIEFLMGNDIAEITYRQVKLLKEKKALDKEDLSTLEKCTRIFDVLLDNARKNQQTGLGKKLDDFDN